MNELTRLSVSEMTEGLAKGDFGAKELTQAHLSRIENTNPTLNSFISVCSKEALTAATKADAELKKHGNKKRPLLGVPVAIKDMLVTQRIETTCASKILTGFVPPYNCTAVAKLEEAGAIVLGKTNQDEFAMGSSNEHSAFGATKNPWNIERSPGGSSGGSAVAVSAGQAPIALGTDTGGSIRQPAAFNGIVGIKPTYGRVSRYGAVAYASSLDQIGTFGRSVEDAALALQIISGKDDNDSTSMDKEVPDYLAELKEHSGQGLKGLRVGVPKEYFIPGMDVAVESSLKEAVRKFSELGAEVVELSLPHTEYALSAYYIIAPAEASSNLSRYDGVKYGYRADNDSLESLYGKTRAEGFGWEVKRRILMGTYVLSAGYYDAYYRKAQQVRRLIKNDFDRAFAKICDLIIAPVAPTTAFQLGAHKESPVQEYLQDIFTLPVNLAGLPGISIPCGADEKDLPIGLQIIGPAFSESLALRAAQEFLLSNPFDCTAQTLANFSEEGGAKT